MKKTIIALAAIALTAVPAFANNNAHSGSDSESNSGATINSSETIEGSIGMGGLPGGRCVTAVQLGIPGVAGIGLSNYQNRCINFEILRQMWNDGVVTSAEYRAAGLKFGRIKFRTTTKVARPAPHAAVVWNPANGYTTCERTIHDDVRAGTRVVLARNLSDSQKKAAVQHCVASLQ
jgi:hypothetical protein